MIYQPALMRDEQYLLDIRNVERAFIDTEAALMRELSKAQYDAERVKQDAATSRAIYIFEVQFRQRSPD